IIITGLGHSREVTEKSLALPAEVTLSFSPYAADVVSWANTARLTAHEKLVDVPLEPPGFPANDPGPFALMRDKGLQENENRLRWILSRFSGYVGVVTSRNEVYTADSEAFKVLLQSIANRGLLLMMPQPSARADIQEILGNSSTPHATADLILDEELLDVSIDSRLAMLEQEARKKGYAVGVIQATPLSLERVRVWAEGLESRGIRLAPVSAVVRLRFS
ncbi:MAG: divergent polysaccharide deacetylase family protein, partial [Bacteroidota bacterium]